MGATFLHFNYSMQSVEEAFDAFKEETKDDWFWTDKNCIKSSYRLMNDKIGYHNLETGVIPSIDENKWGDWQAYPIYETTTILVEKLIILDRPETINFHLKKNESLTKEPVKAIVQVNKHELTDKLCGWAFCGWANT